MNATHVSEISTCLCSYHCNNHPNFLLNFSFLLVYYTPIEYCLLLGMAKIPTGTGILGDFPHSERVRG